MQINLENKSNIDIKNNYGFTNCRSILKELIQGNVNIGAINVNRSSDGIIRKFAPIMEYNGNYYPHLTFKAAGNYISGRNNSDYLINRNGELDVFGHTIPLTKDGDAILNWYGTTGTHNVYSLYKLINSMENKTVDKRK